MKLQKPVFLLLFIYMFAQNFTLIKQRSQGTFLFNKNDLAGWDTYAGADLDSTGKMITDKPVGLNNDSRHV